MTSWNDQERTHVERERELVKRQLARQAKASRKIKTPVWVYVACAIFGLVGLIVGLTAAAGALSALVAAVCILIAAAILT